MLTMPVAGILTDRTGAGRLVLTGVVVITATIAVLTQITDTTSYLVLGVTLFVMGIGLGMTMMPTMSSAMQALRRAEVPKGTTALNIIQQVGGSIGTATLSLLLAHALVSRLPGAGEGEGLAAAQQIPPESRAQLLPVVADAFGSTFVWAAILVAVAFIPALLLPRRPPSALPRDPGDELDEPAPQFLHV
jgi:MFS family permease